REETKSETLRIDDKKKPEVPWNLVEKKSNYVLKKQIRFDKSFAWQPVISVNWGTPATKPNNFWTVAPTSITEKGFTLVAAVFSRGDDFGPSELEIVWTASQLSDAAHIEYLVLDDQNTACKLQGWSREDKRE